MMLCSLGLGQEGYQLESDKATRGLYSRLGYSLLLMRYTYLACDNHEKPF